ncbi:MAG: hypothetical protein ACTSU5_01400 [Promethearchaeota archaeon]
MSDENATPKVSYVERALWWFLKNKVFGGIKTLCRGEYVGFFALGVASISFTTLVVVLSLLTPLVPTWFLEAILLAELLAGFAVLAGGLVAGRLKAAPTYAITLVLVGVAVYFGLTSGHLYGHPALAWTRIAVALTWAVVSVVSMFFLNRSYFTSLASRVVAVGNPKDRVFFQPVVKFVALVGLLGYGYMTLAGDGWWLGVLGLVASAFILRRLYRHPTREETTFASILGFFNVYAFYQLASSFSTTGVSVSSLLLDVGITSFISLYVVQSWTRRVGKIESIEEKVEGFAPKPTLRKKLEYSSRVKEKIGEKGLVLVALGIVFAYHAVFVGLYLNGVQGVPLLSYLGPETLHPSASYHRLALLVALVLVFLALFLYGKSPRFRDFVENKYSFPHVFNLLLKWFRRDNGERAPVELSLLKVGQTIKDAGRDLSDRIRGKRDDVGQQVRATGHEIGDKIRETGQELKRKFLDFLGSLAGTGHGSVGVAEGGSEKPAKEDSHANTPADANGA